VGILVLLLAGSLTAGPLFDVRTVGLDAIKVEATLPAFSTEDSNSACACLVPAPEGRLPSIVQNPESGVRVSLGQVTVAGGVEVVPLVFERMARDTIRNVGHYGHVPSRASVRLVYERGWRGGTDTDEHGRTRTGNAMAALVKAMWGSDEGESGGGEGQTGYLIVVPDEFYNNTLPLAAWKEKKGFTVWVRKTSETGTTKEQIKAYIQTAYSTWSLQPSYVLLVGAVSKIPAFVNPGTPCVTDHPYACVDGADFLADLFVGRLPAANASELDVMVAKILGYEMTPYVADTSWYHRALAVGTSYQEGGTPAVTAMVTKRVIRERLLARGFAQVDTVFYPPTPSGRGPVDSAVNRGVLYVNGRGWGNYEGWRYPSFLINDVSGLQNGWKLPVVTSIYCGTGNYQANPCFGEAWLRVGTPSNPKGAVAFWGSSYTATSTRWNNCMDYGIYEAIFDRGVRTCGPAMYSGKMAQFTNFPLPADSGELRNYFHVYNLFGDPSLEMWTGVPRPLDVSYPATFPVGTSSFEVIVRDGSGRPVRDALVCLHKSSEVHAVKRSDGAGRARFAVATTSADTMFVTVTGPDFIPHLGRSVGVQSGVFVGHLSHDPQTTGPGGSVSLSVVLKNFGASQTAMNVNATLRVLDSSSAVTDSVRNYGDLGPGGTGAASAFGVTVAPACTSGQRLPFELSVASADSVWRSGFEVAVQGPTLKTGGYTVHDANGALDPGENAELSVLVRNSGSGAAAGVSGVLRSLNPSAVQVLDSTGTYGTIGANDSAENVGDRFEVRASGGIGVGRKFSLRLVMRSSDGFEQHWDFPVTVGQPTSSSPLGPDRRGYYAYDDTDAGYAERPSFNWVEIDPEQGGSGTRVTLPNDTAVPVNLPFIFRFYGRDYNTVSVCDNGYVAMGTQWLGDAYNWSIPSPMGPDGIVAPFWDDFRTDTMGAGVFTLDDAANRRFIVEWSRCIHAHGYRPPSLADTQSFQLMLYDPQYHPTATGDGPMLVQYLAVMNDDSTSENGHNFATVGIQSPDHGDGLEYTFAGRYPVAAATVGPNRAIRFTTNPPDTFTAVREEIGDRGRGTEDGFRVRPSPVRRRAVVYLPWGQEARGELRVFDVMGREVRTLAVGARGIIEWDLRDRSWCRVPAGVYVLEARGERREARGERREARGEKREARGESGSRMTKSLRIVVLDD
jgi:hypothetical protein